MAKINIADHCLEWLEEHCICECDLCNAYHHKTDVNFWEDLGQNICIYCDDKRGVTVEQKQKLNFK